MGIWAVPGVAPCRGQGISLALHWRHNDHDGVSNHQPHGCSLNRLFRRRSKETSKLRVTGFCAGNSPGPVNSPHKRPVTRKMFPFDDVSMDFKHLFNQPAKRYGDYHNKDKTVEWLSYLCNGNSYTDKTECLFWYSPLVPVGFINP